MRISLFAILLALTPVTASAQYYNSQRYGNTTYYNGSDGYTGTSQTYGNQSYYNDNRGRSCVTQRYGNQVYTNCN